MSERPLRIAVVGSGISGLSAAWLLSRRHEVTLFEADERLGGHSCTVEASTAVGPLAVDMGFIVYNERTYPNLTALFAHLGVATRESNMGFAVSLEDGAFEYGGDNLLALFAQGRAFARPRFWRMIADLVRFYRTAPGDCAALEASQATLGDYLDRQGYGAEFQNDHILPQAAAIWSAAAEDMRHLPASAFIRFCENHGLLKILDRPRWRTVVGGSASYVERLILPLRERLHVGAPVRAIRRTAGGVSVSWDGGTQSFDQAVIATQADQALALLDDPTPDETRVLGAFGYGDNLAVLHADRRLMPRARGVWSAWNYIEAGATDEARRLCVTYWMNRLQGLAPSAPLFVTLNPPTPPADDLIFRTQAFRHPKFDARALAAQRDLWSLQGRGGLWWCGSYFGSGFHEDGLQAGLAVAEQLGAVRRPWSVPDESGRIHLGARPAHRLEPAFETAA